MDGAEIFTFGPFSAAHRTHFTAPTFFAISSPAGGFRRFDLLRAAAEPLAEAKDAVITVVRIR